MPHAADSRAIVWMFSGQGSQYFQMGKDLYRSDYTFRQWMNRLDEVAREKSGHSIVAVVYADRFSHDTPFEDLPYTQAALFMVQYALAKALLARGFPRPDYLLGASLGEFVATAVAGAVEPERMLLDLIAQAQLFDTSCRGGAMLMVIDQVQTFYDDPLFAGGCELAGINFDGCFVVAGLASRIAALGQSLKTRNITFRRLPIPVAFHSSCIEPARVHFQKHLAEREVRPGTIPIISCARAPRQPNEAPAEPWWNVVREPILFGHSIQHFDHRHPDSIYVDLGPAGNLATFAKYALSPHARDRILPIMTPYGRDAEKVNAAHRRIADAMARRP
ncbi:acyltransferase domain-containing protein [Xanthomonas campestris pv. fici]|uniref:acyltransferase domain-containing protein n=1 Tax=Xanthomonas euvesicatoria TaxID=456327 RepID=UPI003556CEF9